MEVILLKLFISMRHGAINRQSTTVMDRKEGLAGFNTACTSTYRGLNEDGEMFMRLAFYKERLHTCMSSMTSTRTVCI